jgi:hypothetical protein
VEIKVAASFLYMEGFLDSKFADRLQRISFFHEDFQFRARSMQRVRQ